MFQVTILNGMGVSGTILDKVNYHILTGKHPSQCLLSILLRYRLIEPVYLNYLYIKSEDIFLNYSLYLQSIDTL